MLIRSFSLSIVVLLVGAFGPCGLGETAQLDVPSASFPTIQSALDVAQPGDWVSVAEGIYTEALVFPRSGLPGQPIVLMGAPASGAKPVLDASGLTDQHVVLIENRSHIKVMRFEIRDHSVADDGSAIRILGSGSGIELRDLYIHDISGVSAMAITVYGTEASSISDLVIAGCSIADIEAAPSEAITVNGNIDGFRIEDNLVVGVNNIAIDMIGGESDIQPDSQLVARNGLVQGNTVRLANSIYGGGYAAGIYVDGGRDIVIEANLIDGCDLGIEIGAENPGLVTSGVIVRNNQITSSERAGLVVGGYAQEVGRVENCVFRGNTLIANNTVGENGQGVHFQGGGVAEIWVQWGSQQLFEHNLIVAAPPIAPPAEIVYVANWEPGSDSGTTIDTNLYWSTGVAEPGSGGFAWDDVYYGDFGSWRSGTDHDPSSLQADPLVTLDPLSGTYHIDEQSPARNRARPEFMPGLAEVDIDLGSRIQGGRVDLGADEYGSSLLFADDFETADTGAWSQNQGLGRSVILY